jgi:cyclophilin family peptidyl-prolyl cis-trans isomerase
VPQQRFICANPRSEQPRAPPGNAPLSELQRREGEKTVPGEFSDVRHVRGILSMGRYDDPDSATSSFSILLGDAPHLDGKARRGAALCGSPLLMHLR